MKIKLFNIHTYLVPLQIVLHLPKEVHIGKIILGLDFAINAYITKEIIEHGAIRRVIINDFDTSKD